MRYEFKCHECGLTFEKDLPIKDRDRPTTKACKRCGKKKIRKIIRAVSFNVPEGACGNAANGYSEYHGDSENFKARDRGEPKPYKK